MELEIIQKQKELKSISVNQRDLNKKLDEISHVKTSLFALNQQIEKLQDSTCPTCEREWVDVEESQNKLSYLNSQRSVLEGKISQEHVFQKELADSFVAENDLKIVLNKLALDMQTYEVKVKLQERFRLTEKSDKINDLKMTSMLK